MLRLKGTSIRIGSVYLVVGEGPQGENLQILGKLGEALALLGRPFLLLGGLESHP